MSACPAFGDVREGHTCISLLNFSRTFVIVFYPSYIYWWVCCWYRSWWIKVLVTRKLLWHFSPTRRPLAKCFSSYRCVRLRTVDRHGSSARNTPCTGVAAITHSTQVRNVNENVQNIFSALRLFTVNRYLVYTFATDHIVSKFICVQFLSCGRGTQPHSDLLPSELRATLDIYLC